jgi:putative DNA primase/helicase
VWIPEGEHKVELLRSRGLIATCNLGGAGKWLEGFAHLFKGRVVYILPDNDEQARHRKTGELLFHDDGRPKITGLDHAEDIARNLRRVATSIHIVHLPDLPPKGDVIDWARAGGTAEKLLEIAAETPPWTLPPPPVDAAGAILPPEYSEGANALEMVKRHADNVRYVAAWGHWYSWTGTHWAHDEKMQVWHLAHVVCTDIAATIEVQSTARSVASASTRAAVVSLTGQNPKVAATVAQWDADPMLLCTPGGVVDLRTGELRPARREDYCRKITAVAPDAGCPTPVWDAFFRDIIPDDELRKYLYRFFGYALTGLTKEQKFFFFWGEGQNGKSKLVAVVAGILGDYCGFRRKADSIPMIADSG